MVMARLTEASAIAADAAIATISIGTIPNGESADVVPDCFRGEIWTDGRVGAIPGSAPPYPGPP